MQKLQILYNKMIVWRIRCGKCYNNKQKKAMDTMFLELKCFMKIFDESCAEYVNNAIFDTFMINPDTSTWVETGDSNYWGWYDGT